MTEEQTKAWEDSEVWLCTGCKERFDDPANAADRGILRVRAEMTMIQRRNAALESMFRGLLGLGPLLEQFGLPPIPMRPRDPGQLPSNIRIIRQQPQRQPQPPETNPPLDHNRVPPLQRTQTESTQAVNSSNPNIEMNAPATQNNDSANQSENNNQTRQIRIMLVGDGPGPSLEELMHIIPDLSDPNFNYEINIERVRGDAAGDIQ